MKSDELKVFISNRESICSECNENLGHHAWIFLTRSKGALCLSCADLDHLEFLPTGNTALTVRAKKYSGLYAVVLKWSRSRKRYERQGLLVEQEALDKAEQECLNDADIREKRRIREAEKREQIDREFVKNFADQIRKLYSMMPPGREKIIAEHACKKYSGRVGRSAAAKDYDENAIDLAVIAHIRHTMTEYDGLLSKGYERFDARALVKDKVDGILESWRISS